MSFQVYTGVCLNNCLSSPCTAVVRSGRLCLSCMRASLGISVDARPQGRQGLRDGGFLGIGAAHQRARCRRHQAHEACRDLRCKSSGALCFRADDRCHLRGCRRSAWALFSPIGFVGSGAVHTAYVALHSPRLWRMTIFRSVPRRILALLEVRGPQKLRGAPAAARARRGPVQPRGSS